MLISKGFTFLFFALIAVSPVWITAQNADANILIYTDPVQIDTNISDYENITSKAPIRGTIMVTHNVNNQIDPSSFRLGENPLKAEFVQSTAISPYSPLVVTIYQFQLEGIKKGSHTLPPIRVKVGGKDYQAAPLTIEVPY